MFNPKVLRDTHASGFSSSPEANPAGFSSSRRFKKMFNKMIGKKALNKNPRGLDKARGLGQVHAAIAGRNNTKRTPQASNIDPVAAAMQHTVRNRSTEQAGNAINTTTSLGRGVNPPRTVLQLLGRG